MSLGVKIIQQLLTPYSSTSYLFYPPTCLSLNKMFQKTFDMQAVSNPVNLPSFLHVRYLSPISLIVTLHFSHDRSNWTLHNKFLIAGMWSSVIPIYFTLNYLMKFNDKFLNLCTPRYLTTNTSACCSQLHYCIPYSPRNKHPLFCYTALTDWSL